MSIAIKSGHENIAILIRDYGWKSIQNIVKNCKSLLLYLPKNLTKIVYDYLVESKDKSGDLIDETSSTYSDNKFIKTLEIAFEKHPTTTISPYISFGDKDLFLQNINSIKNTMSINSTIIIPLHINNHLGGLVIKKGLIDQLQFIYIDPNGNKFVIEKTAQSLIEAIVKPNLLADDIFTLVTKENANHSLDALLVKILVTLAQSDPNNFDITDLAPLFTIKLYELRLEQVTMLHKAGILAGMPEIQIIEDNYACKLQEVIDPLHMCTFTMLN